MDYSYIDSFKKIKKRQMAVAFMILPLLALKIFRYRLSSLTFLDSDIFGIFLVAFVISALIFSFVNWKCPKCDKYLGRNISIRHCPHCGEQLVE